MTVSQRINYNKAVLTYKALNNLTPAYISDLLTPTAIAYGKSLLRHLVTSLECYYFITHVRNCVMGATPMNTLLILHLKLLKYFFLKNKPYSLNPNEP